MIWSHPDVETIHSQTLRVDGSSESPYISYDIYRYPKNRICESEKIEPAFILTKRGSIIPKFYVYRTEKKAYVRLTKELANFDEDIEPYLTLYTIAKVARR